MEKNEVQSLFSLYIFGDSLLQLNNGKIIFYYFRKKSKMYIYNIKTFKLLYMININKLIYIFKEGKLNIDDFDKWEDKDVYIKCDTVDLNNNNTIKELDNGLILIGRDFYIFEFKFHEKLF